VLDLNIDRRKCIKHDEEEEELINAGIEMEVFKNYR